MRVRLEPGEQELYRTNLTPEWVSMFRSIPRLVVVTNQRIITYTDDNGAINDIESTWLRNITHLSRHEALNILGMEYWVSVTGVTFFVKTWKQREELAAAIDHAIDQLP